MQLQIQAVFPGKRVVLIPNYQKQTCFRCDWADSIVNFFGSKHKLGSSSQKSWKICQRSWASARSLFLPNIFLLTFQTGITTTPPGLILPAAKITEGGEIHYTLQTLGDFSHPDSSARAPSLWQETNHPLQYLPLFVVCSLQTEAENEALCQGGLGWDIFTSSAI